MKLYSEHTEWTGGGVNHWYLLDTSRQTILGYRKFGEGAVTMLRTPLPFYEKGRKLKLEHDFGDTSRKVIKVQGSKGDIHHVDLTLDRPSCSCHAFKFRGDCKHIAIARGSLIC
jgi:hypothetical protein